MKKFIIVICCIGAGVVIWQFSLQNSENGPRPSPESIPSPQAQSPTSSPVLTPTSSPSATVKPAAKKKATATPKPSTLQAAETYEQALAIYRVSGYRFQFSGCHASPGWLTLKTGQKFMLDNRDNTVRMIAVGQKTYTLTAYGFAVASAPTAPGTYYITCDGGGTGSIIVQL